MHACGHDRAHGVRLLGTAEIMARSKNTWHGTLMLIGQPAEETISGAEAMLRDGLFTRFPKPDVAVALHVGNELPAGTVGITPGVYNTNADSLRITIYGKGGHGSMPQTTIDPIVIAARTILALQTIVSREIKPGEMGVVTVGYIHAGTKNNIIPDQAEMGLTVRTYKTRCAQADSGVRSRASPKAEAAAAGAPREPLGRTLRRRRRCLQRSRAGRATSNAAGSGAGQRKCGYCRADHAFGRLLLFRRAGSAGILFQSGRSGSAEVRGGESIRERGCRSNHSPLFAPDVDPAITAGIAARLRC